jgi:hypothetical protein
MIFPACRRHGEASSRRRVYQRGGWKDNQAIAATAWQSLAGFLFAAFSSREPVSIPHQVRDRLSLENALNRRHFPFDQLAFNRPRSYIGLKGLNAGHDDDDRRNQG